MAEERNLLVVVKSVDRLEETAIDIHRRGLEIIATFKTVGVLCVRGDPDRLSDMQGIVFREEQVMSVN